MDMTPNKPYLIRAFYEWIVDNNLTPYLVVNASIQGCKVPTQHIQNGQIVLNILPSAVGNMLMGNDVITFNARFGGKPFALTVPIKAVLAIYARENGAGTMFDAEEDSDEDMHHPDSASGGDEMGSAEQHPSDDEPTDPNKGKKVSHLRVIK
ncbi:MAG: ClpXP protease specificity-enhancing factor [Gammaproteobacteria bacterium]|nr:ClpXP protease specificity-enhancing factor [Gammaproteobacteria bacterium]MBU2057576.1 ClpXP protease specificity-enhancing factor [Gammaproteobacteria bacterium]MBU2176336.1 ClpXP protease specificity-enhancing factor [Gammaproteobacteria bacterium]MBU2245937.1 ClpXP protease specificity-enhancing factor [Gammaproteobacteria bacterium]MBU2343066.1 ClpXP protease specificity-enhancing factor [Gammaproteobacteria bacterium]